MREKPAAHLMDSSQLKGGDPIDPAQLKVRCRPGIHPGGGKDLGHTVAPNHLQRLKIWLRYVQKKGLARRNAIHQAAKQALSRSRITREQRPNLPPPKTRADHPVAQQPPPGLTHQRQGMRTGLMDPRLEKSGSSCRKTGPIQLLQFGKRHLAGIHTRP